MSGVRVRELRRLTLAPGAGARLPAHVSAASGLARAGDFFYVIPDDELHLAVFPARGAAPGRLVRLLPGTLPAKAKPRKRRKPDFESLARLPGPGEGSLLALGSCSKPNRCVGILVELGGRHAPGKDKRRIEMDPLREALERSFGRLNIEGAYVVGEELHLLQRGNKGDRRNARIRLRLGAVMRDLLEHGRLGASGLRGIEEIELGSVDDVPLCFTDGAALPDGRVVFSAVAEDTSDSYADGACRGAAIGVLSPRGKLQRLEALERCHKVEGVDAWLEDGAIRALLVTDADDPAIPAALLACRIAAK